MTNEIECVRKHLQCVLTLKAMDAWDSIQDTNTEAYNLPFVAHAIAEVVAVSFAVAYDRSNAVVVFAPMALVWADLNLNRLREGKYNAKTLL